MAAPLRRSLLPLKPRLPRRPWPRRSALWSGAEAAVVGRASPRAPPRPPLALFWASRASFRSGGGPRGDAGHGLSPELVLRANILVCPDALLRGENNEGRTMLKTLRAIGADLRQKSKW